MIDKLNTARTFILLALLITSFIACKSDNKAEHKSKESSHIVISNKEQLYGSWKIFEADSVFFPNGIYNEKEAADLRKKIKSKGFIYSFFPDNIASVVEGKKYYGSTWELNGDVMNFTRIKEGLNDTAEYKIKNIKCYEKGKYPFFIAEIEDLGIFQFRQIGAKLAEPKEDPYHPINNQWRVTATKSETYKEMRKRLYNYTQHCHYLFKSSIERDILKVYSGNTPAIYKYYDGAIGIVDGGKIPSAWMANFYAPDEAMDAYAMAKKYFKGKMIYKKNEGGYVIANEVIFRELLKKMKEDL